MEGLLALAQFENNYEKIYEKNLETEIKKDISLTSVEWSGRLEHMLKVYNISHFPFRKICSVKQGKLNVN